MKADAAIDKITGESILREKFKSPLAAIPQGVYKAVGDGDNYTVVYTYDYDVSRTITFSTSGATGYISVGIIDPKGNPAPGTMHESWDGSFVNYGLLFRALINAGYDPLLPVRQPEYVGKVVKPMIKIAIKSCLSNIKHGKTHNLTSALNIVKNKILKDILNYIVGSFKPPLEESTMRNRSWREEQDPTLYEAGFRTALFETGNLADAIKVKIIVTRDDLLKVLYLQSVKGLESKVRGGITSPRMAKESVGIGYRLLEKAVKSVAKNTNAKKGSFSLDAARKTAEAYLFSSMAKRQLEYAQKQHKWFHAEEEIKEFARYEATVVGMLRHIGVIEKIGNVNIFGMDYSTGRGLTVK